VVNSGPAIGDQMARARSGLSGSLLLAGRIFWLLFALFFWAYWLASVPVFLQRAADGRLPTVASATNVEGDWIPSQVATERAAAWGLAVPAWSWISVIQSGVSFLATSLIALIIWWRLPTGFGLLTAFTLLATGGETLNVAIYSAGLSETAELVWHISALGWPFYFLWLFLFPDGRAVPKRLLWLFGPLLVVFSSIFLVYLARLLGAEIPMAAPTAALDAIALGLIVSLFLLTLVAQLYRYRRVSGTIERRQTKWFVYGLGLTVALAALFDVLNVPTEISALAFLMVPIGVGISILRYRLWDIDLIIRRTLVYSALTALLALVYLGSVLLLQTAFGRLAGEESPLIIVVSTLLIAALFSPLRRRLQALIDRRFFRQKYDAQRVLAAFAQTARDETDIAALNGELMRVVQETMRPATLKLWLKPARSQAQRLQQ
jgi:hypothetical protein